MKRRNAFTLVELLAVIVILAVILVIAVPQVMNIIEDTKKASFASTAKILANSAEKKYVQNEILGVNEVIDCSTVSKLNKEDYSSCDISINNGVALVTLVGSGKFEGMKVLNGTKTTATVISSDSEELYTLEDVYEMVGDLTSELEQLRSKVQTNETDISSNKDNLTKLTNKDSNDNVFLKNYPVGSVYMSSSSTNPGTLFGGEWEQLKDRFLLGAGSTYEAGSTGGEATHTLTINEMPSHTHTHMLWVFNGSTASGTHYGFSWERDVGALTDGEKNSTVPHYNENTGNSQPHNNMPPYLTVYMWKRTA